MSFGPPCMHLVCERFTLALGPRSGRADHHHHERFPVAETPREHCSLAALGVTATPGTTRNRTQRTRARRACPGLPRVGCVHGEFEGAGKLGEPTNFLASPPMPPRHHATMQCNAPLLSLKLPVSAFASASASASVSTWASASASASASVSVSCHFFPLRRFAHACLPACTATCMRTRKASLQWS